MNNQDAYYLGKNALIFGGGKGIGKAVAKEFAARGASVAIADIDLDAAQETAAGIVAQGGLAIGLKADALSDQSIATTTTVSESSLGDLDIVVNNVGAMLNGHPEDIPMAEWQRMMDLNYFSPIRSLQIILPKFLAKGC